MTKDIIRKLREHLSHPVDTECAVVYLLAEIRKLLDAHKPAPKPFALWMYCHWALHVDLTKSNTTMHFLERVDAFVINTVAGFKGNAAYSIIDSHNLFREFVYLDAFREQLLAILASYDMPTELCDDDEAWFRFMSAYAGVVEDGPSRLKPTKPTRSRRWKKWSSAKEETL